MSIRKRLLVVLALCSVAMIAFTGLLNNTKGVSAQPIVAASSDFYMEEGAQVRTAPEEMGIRFKATITEDYWQNLLVEYGEDATFSFYSIVTDGTTPIKKNYENLTPDFSEDDSFELFSTIIYNTQDLIDRGLIEQARALSLSAKTYIDVIKAGESDAITISAYGETGFCSMRAIANDYVLQGLEDEELMKYIVVGNRSEKVEGYVFADNSGIIEMEALPDLTQATDMEVYFGTKKLDATYENGVISFSGVVLEEGQTQAYVSVFTGGKVYSSKVALATKITQANVADLLKLNGNETVYLAENIDLSDYSEWISNVEFTGTFDGGNHTIDCLTIPTNGTAGFYPGFFKTIQGTVKNVAFTNVWLKGNCAVLGGGLSGKLTVSNVFIQVTKASGAYRTSLIVERVTSPYLLEIEDVVATMPGTANVQKVFGYCFNNATANLKNFYGIGIGTDLNSPYATSGGSGIINKDNVNFYADLAKFNSANKTLTDFLTSCVATYLNANA